MQGRWKVHKKRERRIDFDSDSDVVPPGGKGKGKSKKTTFKGIGQRVEVRYSNGVRYKGTLITHGHGWLNLMLTMKQP